MIEYKTHLHNTIPIIYIIGLSAKPNCEHLSITTKTGQIINKIINQLPFTTIVKTNLVKFPPVDQSGKLRYPDFYEMKIGWEELKVQINQDSPLLLVLLGQQVSYFLRSQIGIQPKKSNLPHDFSYQIHPSQFNSALLSIHHPSFIYVYRRKEIECYVQKVAFSISNLIY